MGKPELKPRVIKVTGYLVLDPKDGAYTVPIDEVTEDVRGGMIDFIQLNELTVTEMPNATVTAHGIRTDL